MAGDGVGYGEVLFESSEEPEAAERGEEAEHAAVSAAAQLEADAGVNVPLAGGAIAEIVQGDARDIPLEDDSVDLVVTSPPYWKKRDYGVPDQIGQEPTVGEYVEAILDALREWRRVLRRTGSVFLNIGDTYDKKSLAGVPARVEHAARDDGWIVRNRVIWAKPGGMPEPAQNRLANRHEYILHLVASHDYYYDMFGYAARFGNGANPGDIWNVALTRGKGTHLAPFPEEIVERAITLACPGRVCAHCGEPSRRIVRRTANLDPSRPQARRAMQLKKEKGLTDAHIAAIQATGISDAGKAQIFQNGTGRNSAEVRRLAAEAKEALGGYFREFTFAQRETAGWTACECAGDAEVEEQEFVPGVVLDPFMGSGTTLRVAQRLGRSAFGVDLVVPEALEVPLGQEIGQ
jgi:DNA modification methylase